MVAARKVTRDVRSGRFVLATRARTAPTLTVTETVPIRLPVRKVNRDARTGRFVTTTKAQTAPTRTFTQSVFLPAHNGHMP
jgi:hypothetical protein